MITYIAYFDILGFKEFVLNNEKDYIDRNFQHIFLESQIASSGEKYIDFNYGSVPDIDQAEVNCLHVSDSIVFWTIDNSEKSFRKIIDVCYTFYWRCMQATFPIRGCVVLGDIEFHPFKIKGKDGSSFFNSSLFGKGLIDVYLKAESQDWAGCYIDKSAVTSVKEEVIYELFQKNKIVYYGIPLKDGTTSYEHTIRITGSNLDNISFRNNSKDIERLFSNHMKGKPLTESVKRKMNNTIKFLEFFRTEEERKEEEK